MQNNVQGRYKSLSIYIPSLNQMLTLYYCREILNYQLQHTGGRVISCCFPYLPLLSTAKQISKVSKHLLFGHKRIILEYDNRVQCVKPPRKCLPQTRLLGLTCRSPFFKVRLSDRTVDMKSVVFAYLLADRSLIYSDRNNSLQSEIPNH